MQDEEQQAVSNLQSLLYTVGNLASCHFDAKAVHCLFKRNSVLASVNGVNLNVDNLHVILIKDSFLCKL